MIPKLFEFFIGKPGSVAILTADPSAVPTSRHGRIREHYKFLRFPYTLEGTMKDAVPETEDRRVGSNPQGQRENRDGRKDRIAGHQTQCITEVLKNHVSMLLGRDCQRVD